DVPDETELQTLSIVIVAVPAATPKTATTCATPENLAVTRPVVSTDAKLGFALAHDTGTWNVSPTLSVTMARKRRVSSTFKEAVIGRTCTNTVPTVTTIGRLPTRDEMVMLSVGSVPDCTSRVAVPRWVSMPLAS